MAKQTFSFTVDDELNKEVYEVIQSRPSGERSSYIRDCIEFYEKYKDKVIWDNDKVIDMFSKIMSRLDGGVMTFRDDPGIEQDAMFEEMLSQFD